MPPPEFEPSAGHAFRQWWGTLDFRGFRESYAPILWALAAAICAAAPEFSARAVAPFLEKVVPTFVTAAAIYGAFQATSQSLMLALIGAPVLSRLPSKHFRQLIGYFRSANRSLALFIGVSLLVLSMHTLEWTFAGFHRLAMGAIALCFVLAWTTSFRVSRLILQILLIHGQENHR